MLVGPCSLTAEHCRLAKFTKDKLMTDTIFCPSCCLSVLFKVDTCSVHCSDEQKFTKSPNISYYLFKNFIETSFSKTSLSSNQNDCLLSIRTVKEPDSCCFLCLPLSLANHNCHLNRDRTDDYRVSGEGKEVLPLCLENLFGRITFFLPFY